MHTVWKGAISFGLVHIPIKLYTATENKDVKFNYLHDKCRSRINYERHCPVCDKDVAAEEIIKGYEYESGKYVVLSDEDLSKLPLETSKAINIISFVDLSDVDPIYFEKSYYIAPDSGGQKAFELLKQAMQKTGKTAVSKVVIRSKESLAAIRPHQNGIIMETMFYPDEIRPASAISELAYKVNIGENELKMAENLISSLSEKFEPEKFRNEYREALMELVQSKIAGEEVEVPPRPEEGKVVDLMEALKASIKRAQETKNDEGQMKKVKSASRRKTS